MNSKVMKSTSPSSLYAQHAGGQGRESRGRSLLKAAKSLLFV